MDLNRKIDDLAAFVAKLSNQINELEKTTAELKRPPQVPNPGVPEPVKVETVAVKPKPPEPVKVETVAVEPTIFNAATDFEELKNLLNSPKWPAAVDPSLICNLSSDQDKEDRAEGILDLIIDVHLENLRFLDFGCGEGHVNNKSLLQKPHMSVGYDVVKSDRWGTWTKADNIAFTDNWEEVEKHKPYNVILIYDVLDHMIIPDAQIVEYLKKVKSVLAPNGKIYVRCHPWCSRHGTHLYHQINKAFIHLVFNDEELKQMGYETAMPTRELIHPLEIYTKCFKSSGLKIQFGPQALKESVEPFFINTSSVTQRIRSRWHDSSDASLKSGKKFPNFQCEIQFADYILG